MILNINQILKNTEVNGPGKRFGIWVQGCSRKCKGCFNTHMHNHAPNKLLKVNELFSQIIQTKNICGISISGGEPFEQFKPVLKLVKMIKQSSNLDVLIFTGYEFSHIKKFFPKSLEFIDILITGKFVEEKKISQPLIGSSNQEIHFLTKKYTLKDLKIPQCEVHIKKNGQMFVSGII